ncbi:MAG: hypothetical protein KBF28_05345 [Gemmatimonadales bacterium]|nr:hypothetical protein [Gemmatimonadales bacterium]
MARTRATMAQDAKKGGNGRGTPPMPERQLQALVRLLALRLGYLHYHTHNSRRSEYGFPDSVIVKGSRLLFVELKSERGTLSVHQEVWLATLRLVPGVEVYVWRPEAWYSGEIERVLRGEEG